MNPQDDPSNQNPKPPAEATPAVEMIRQKIGDLYRNEPEAGQEMSEATEAGSHRSKHQQFMYQLSGSGKSLAEIQMAWHNYYVALPDDEKHAVWREFYEQHSKNSHYAQQLLPQGSAQPAKTNQPLIGAPQGTQTDNQTQTVSGIKNQLLDTVRSRNKPTAKQHLHSLVFGLSMGAVAVFILLFGFFNERFVAPLITPSKNVSSSSIIIDPNNTAVGPDTKIVIPKINVEIPVVYDQKSIDEKAMQASLENGVVHYPTTSNPGEVGNGAIFGHSSNNILNHGKYKFAFVLLKRLENGDTFYLQKGGKRYVYKVYDKKIVKPTDISVLGATDKKATFTLITCDPPGTSINRLVVVGEQISPDPNQNTASTAQKPTTQVAVLPSNAPSLWNRLWSWVSN